MYAYISKIILPKVFDFSFLGEGVLALQCCFTPGLQGGTSIPRPPPFSPPPRKKIF